MTNEQVEKLQAIATEMDDLNINRSVIYPTDEQKKRIRAAVGLSSGHIPSMSLWGGLGVSILPYGYGGVELEYRERTNEYEEIKTKYQHVKKYPLTDKLTNVCIEVFNEIVTARKDEVAKSMQNKPLAEFKEEVNAFAIEYVKAHYKEYKVEVYSNAKRQCDTNSDPCEVIVILGSPYRSCDQIGGIRLRQDRYGAYHLVCSRMCCGEWKNEFTADNYKEKIAECIQSII